MHGGAPTRGGRALALPTDSPEATVEALRRLAPASAGFAAMAAALVARHRRSLEWHARARRVGSALPGLLPYEPNLLPLYVERAQGARLVDVDGHELVDCHLGYTAGLLGHGFPPAREAARRALDAGVGPGVAVPAQVRLCELVCAATGAERAALFHTGGEAVAAAVRLARAATGRPAVAKFEGCYHGSTWVGLPASSAAYGWPADRPLDAGGEASPGAGSLMVLPYGDDAALARIEAEAGRLAAVVVDPAPLFAADRFAELAPFLRRLRAATEAGGVVLVVDEVVSGFRLAPGGAQEAFGFRGDLACYAKIVSGAGLPLAVLAGRAALLDQARSDGALADRPGAKQWLASTLAAGAPAVAAGAEQLGHVLGHHAEVMGAVDGAHRRLAAALEGVRDRTGIAVRVYGHPRLQPVLSLELPGGRPPGTGPRAGGGWYREALAGAGPATVPLLLAATLYLRAHGVYARGFPTMALSAAHGPGDVDAVAGAVEAAVMAMVEHGLLPGGDGSRGRGSAPEGRR